MPRLACWSCGRQIYTTSPIESLFAEERRCPRCGAYLNAERRETERRQRLRRMNPADDPGPPEAEADRRTTDRRTGQRRSGGSAGGSSGGHREGEGWVD
jgi:DNA-directed RNA polymerase subunit RPC12/RpoP